MKFAISTRISNGFQSVLHGVLQPERSTAVMDRRIGQLIRQGLAVVLSALMIMIPMGQGMAFAQEQLPSGPPPVADNGNPPPQGQPLAPDQLDQLVAPIALYPDALVAQILAASTYPTQIVEADRWRQSQGNASPEQIASGAESHNWDPSVKALTAFPTVLVQLDRNIQWTTDLGNAYYNQPQDVMDSVQAMRQKAQAAGNLRSTPQQTVSNDNGQVVIAPANPTVVYVPAYNPWAVYGPPLAVYPGFYWGPPPGVFWGGLAIGFGIGIGIGVFAHWGWGWGHWGVGWGNHAVFYNHNTYITRSTTVINRGYGRPGGPARGFVGARGAYARNGGFNRAAGFNHSASYNHAAAPGFNRSGTGAPNRGNAASFNHGASSSFNHGNASSSNRGSTGSFNRSSSVASSHGGGFNRGAGTPSGGHAPSSSRSSGGGHPSGASHPSGGHPSGGHSSGGHSGGGEHKR